MADIPASNPLVVPAKSEEVFDKYGVEKFETLWPNLTGPMECNAIFRAARRDQNGVLIPGPASKPYTVPNLWERMYSNPKIGQAFGLIVEALTEEAMKDGAI